mmetsp:Transcript_16278/g.21301  ORF Transcript_16278/g.21301 Transcript_16278/m.21301 type:complete len:153 (-) Transcript_16278:258-716(-)|eukprot:CAMPEP_0198143746 /NCGR_PEP_ID=MMETSP1443-20131203/10384_1 /TAXON_ID=186043 /ORGANISM="Entomoneis sp., Strain CCMP2396" /LENGTH=152 /DNA_ID=CAMNT_0043807031 /DNA_START=255 /DNA_END=713 /DNA_ORIENTATION=+
MPVSRRNNFHHSDASTVLTTGDHSDWMERTGTKLGKFLSKSACRLCTVYADEQVEYEKRQEDYVTTMDRMVQATARSVAKSTLEVDLYKHFLFDEESVVNSFGDDDRQGGDDISLNPSVEDKGRSIKSPHRRGEDDDDYEYGQHAISTQRSH